MQAISAERHLEVWSGKLSTGGRECAIEHGNLGEFSSLGELEGTGREAGYQKWNQEQRLKGKQMGALALELGSWPWITFLDQMGEGEGSERHKGIGEYGLDRELSARQGGDPWV